MLFQKFNINNLKKKYLKKKKNIYLFFINIYLYIYNLEFLINIICFKY